MSSASILSLGEYKKFPFLNSIFRKKLSKFCEHVVSIFLSKQIASSISHNSCLAGFRWGRVRPRTLRFHNFKSPVSTLSSPFFHVKDTPSSFSGGFVHNKGLPNERKSSFDSFCCSPQSSAQTKDGYRVLWTGYWSDKRFTSSGLLVKLQRSRHKSCSSVPESSFEGDFSRVGSPREDCHFAYTLTIRAVTRDAEWKAKCSHR